MSTSREEGVGEGVAGHQETAQGVMAIRAAVHHITMIVHEQAVAVVPQHMAGPIMAMGIGRSRIVTATVAGIATGLLSMDMVVEDLLELVVVVAGDDETVGPVVYF